MTRRITTLDFDDRELMRLTRDLDAAHRDTMPRFLVAAADLAETAREQLHSVAGRATTRRTFLAGSAAAGGGLLLAACGSSGGGAATSPTAQAVSPDLQVARLAASLEVLAVNAYNAALQAASSGALGAVPPAVGTFATTARDQHQQHADAWNAVLSQAGQPAQHDPDPALNGQVNDMLKQVKDVPGVAKLALTLEQIAVETYTGGVMKVQDAKAREVAATIAPVEAQHVAILHFVLGEYPVPDTFIPIDQARTPSDLSH
jgi:rubrerythrin